MKILVAPNAFKGALDALEAAKIIKAELEQRDPYFNIEISPIADGGDGTCDLLGSALGLEKVEVITLDAIGRSKLGYYYWDRYKQLAFIDVSIVSGIKVLNKNQINPFIASTYGTGLLIKDAIARGVVQVYLGLGGSASIDLGIGILQALGFSFLDDKGRALIPFTDSFFTKISHIQRPIQASKIRFTCICDVSNSFFGANGAVKTFGPQKGLPISEIEEFETKSKRITDLLSLKTLKDIPDSFGFGAAGGIAYGLSYFYPVEIEAGSSWFFNIINLEEKIKHCDTVITGEGIYDRQSKDGKGCFELLRLAKKFNKKSILITSKVEGIEPDFDQVILLPYLDFNSGNFKDLARGNLKSALANIEI
ncbi:glycerate kinase [Belliella buryatensis]|uniref:Glycerate kinase n=1 Tax=Belliella buryatensis TaxID=1500549 RepID=A0A239D656_9BACT|nr:glycerate kinase [Belliella buryatensis]SNS27063.1 glycerate kinase [Belliella buryatensis]